MRIDVLTILPEVVEAFASASLLGKARRDGVLDVRIHDIRDAATDVHRSVDDSPFGGGAGMVLKPEPVFDTVERVEILDEFQGNIEHHLYKKPRTK